MIFIKCLHATGRTIHVRLPGKPPLNTTEHKLTGVTRRINEFVSQSSSFKTTFIASLGLVFLCNRRLVGFLVHDRLYISVPFFF